MPSISIADGYVAKLGEPLRFDYETGQLHGNQHPRIEIDAYQEDALVYAAAAPADEEQLLGGAGSDWLTNGGPAVCTATLYYWDFHPVQTFVPLATVTFTAEG